LTVLGIHPLERVGRQDGRLFWGHATADEVEDDIGQTLVGRRRVDGGVEEGELGIGLRGKGVVSARLDGGSGGGGDWLDSDAGARGKFDAVHRVFLIGTFGSSIERRHFTAFYSQSQREEGRGMERKTHGMVVYLYSLLSPPS
jgi:hypothetical protein